MNKHRGQSIDEFMAELMKALQEADYSHLPEPSCPKCKGWGIQNPHTYRVSPCPKCGVGKLK